MKHNILKELTWLFDCFLFSNLLLLCCCFIVDIVDAGHYECNILLEVGSSQQQHLTLPIEVNCKYIATEKVTSIFFLQNRNCLTKIK